MTLTTARVEEVIKTDGLGRMRTSAQRRESLLGEFDKSGLSAKKFAELSGVKYQTLATWLQKRRKQAKCTVKATDSAKWLEAVVGQAENPAGPLHAILVLRLPGGAQIELAQTSQIPMAVALVRALSQPC